MTEPDTGRKPVLQLQEITKTYPGVRALDGASLSVYPGEVHALMGENGAGKSTLIKILAGAVRADSGTVRLDGTVVEIGSPQKAMNLGVSIIYQELNLVPHLTVAENIFLGREPKIVAGWIDQRKMRRTAQKLMDGLGMEIDVRTLVGRLSVAQRQMVEIAKATSRKSRVIAMDEPSATLTDHELGKLMQLIRRLKEEQIGLIYISHRMDEVFEIADSMTVMRDGRTVGSGTIAEIKRDQVLRWMVGRDLDETYPKITSNRGRPMLEIKGLTRKGVLNNINLTVHAGEIVALAGLVGAGRTEIARCIFGADRFQAGEIKVDGMSFYPRSPSDAIRAGIGFVTEDRKEQGIILRMAVRENITLSALRRFSRLGFISRRKEAMESNASVARLRVRTPTVEQRVVNLSGGNQQKIVVAKWLLTSPRVLILDEPTRGIDVGAKREIYEIMNELTASGVAILMISSELPEVLGMADRIFVVRDGRIVGEKSRASATQENIVHLALAG